MESTESQIRTILRECGTPEQKAEQICKFMTWNKKRVIEVITNFGNGYSNEMRNKIVIALWRKR